MDKKIFTYVSPKTNQEVSNCMCSKLPILIKPVNTVEELFPLLSDPSFHTDFVCISIDMFYQREDNLDMFDIIHTLATLIRSTVHRCHGNRPQKRDTKIFVIVDEDTNPKLVKEVMNVPDVVSIGWVIKKEEDLESTIKYGERLIAGDYTHHPKVIELLKSKKKNTIKESTIKLTLRQQQVLKLIQDRGASNKTIAKMLKISESTVKLHMGAILKKFGAKNRTQLAVFSKNKTPA